ncbi:MAG: DUF2281 domain-containing protein [Gammaproteobacteria bacterium]|nr:DUF2281 domain-containing protein [Gammaproteobacteria bacterium]
MHDNENRLREVFRSLPESEARSLLDFAEFLLTRVPLKSGAADIQTLRTEPAPVSKPAEPVVIPRVEGESVIAAVKRLSATYHMLGKDTMLNVTADLVSQSLMGMRDKVEVIDELEEIFLKQYQLHTKSK